MFTFTARKHKYKRNRQEAAWPSKDNAPVIIMTENSLTKEDLSQVGYASKSDESFFSTKWLRIFKILQLT